MKDKIRLIPISVLLLVAIAACSGTASSITPTQVSGNQSPSSAAGQQTLSPEMAASLEGLQQAYEKVYQSVLPSVVNIQVSKTVASSAVQMPDFANPFGAPDSNQSPEFKQSGLGSGFVWDSAGHIVTNNHVVDGADTIRVTFSDGSSKSAKVVGTDVDSDLAVIKVDLPAAKLTPIQITDSTKVRVGQVAIAIGEPFGLEGTMTVGIISGLGRSLPVESSSQDGVTYTIPDVIQTDAPINPGNSGGVLVDINGKLMGVTTAIESPVRGSAGVGYVVPSIIVQKVVPVLIAKGSYQHAWLGLSGRTITAEMASAMKLSADQRGALVVSVSAGSPAEKAGLRGSETETTIEDEKVLVGGDVIIKINDQPIQDFEDLAAYLARYTEVGQTIKINALRDGKEQQFSATLQARPSSSAVPAQAQPKGKVMDKSWLGIQGTDLTPEIISAMKLDEGVKGALVLSIVKGSPAEKGGLRSGTKSFSLNGQEMLIGGDVITAVDSTPVINMQVLATIIGTYKPGTTIKLSIIRENKDLTLDITLAEKPTS